MKRDFDLIRKILIEAENCSVGEGFQLPALMERISGYSGEEIGYHVQLLAHAGLIDGEVYGYPIQAGIVLGLTWAGHDFLDDARSDTVWNKTKTKLVEVGGSASLEVLKALLIQTAKQLFDLPP